ncbi:MAG: hypothetical protein MJE77_30715 [Proteobacteria bacterium]|nr:hypothetical protein [Pseudomonadota bacterium]
MNRYLAGDVSAFHELYRQVRPYLQQVLQDLTGKKTDLADKLLEKVFLKIHYCRGQYVAGADPLPWFRAIAERCHRGAVRKRRALRIVRYLGRHSQPTTTKFVRGSA